MAAGWPLLAVLDFAMREAALFSACGFLLLGASDLAVDLIWIVHKLRRSLGGGAQPCADGLPPPERPGRLAIFIPAWDEAAVIDRMLRHALATFDQFDYRLYVGCYPNDPATVAAVESVRHPRVRLVVGTVPGPTTKADCLNRLWQAMLVDERSEGLFKAVVLHDAEDVVHSAELRLFDLYIGRYDLVQLPVLPLPDPNSRWIAGHYADEFAEAHGKELVVREALGAALPSAGVGCAFSRAALGRLADASGAAPFDADSLTEDYELGLKLARGGGRSVFLRIRAAGGRALVMTREYFPGTLRAAVAQKSRWMEGIALSGWDRLGWWGGFGERWMRLRDRQSVLAAILLFAGYAALLLWALLAVAEALGWEGRTPVTEPLASLMALNGALLVWRLAMRCLFVTRACGWREGLRSIPRVVTGNAIAMLAARRAVLRYLGFRRTGIAAWAKTGHDFPARPGRMKGPPPPLRFLALVVGGWIGVRAALLAPEWLTPPAEAEARPPDARIATRAADEPRPFRSSDAVATTHSPVRSRARRQAQRTRAFAAGGALQAPGPRIFASSGVVSAAGPADTPAAPEATAIPASILQPLPARPASRWSGSAWLFARSGGGRGLAAGGSLGGSQAGARLLYRLDPRLALSARLYTPLERARGAEAALGLEWQPSRTLPLRLLAERRQALGRDGRSASALLAHGGVSERRVAGPLRLDAYAQAGVVGLSRRDAFADGALRLSLPLEKDLSAGAGLWGAAQPGVSRLDVGPSLSLRHRIGGTNLRLSADWRFRIAGEAAPGSGPAVTLAGDF